MKIIIASRFGMASLSLITCFTGCFPPPNQPVSDPTAIKEIAIIINPQLSVANWVAAKSKLTDYIQESPPGTRFRFILGGELLTIGKPIVVPVLKYPSPNAVGQNIGPGLDEVFKEIESVRARILQKDSLGFDLPGTIGHLIAQPTDRPMSVLVLGPLIYDSPGAPGFSMKNGAVPNGIAIATNLAASPFGTSDYPHGRLSNVVMHVCYFSENCWTNSFFKEAVVEFYAKWAARQGGVLASASPDLAGTLLKLNNSGLPSLVSQTDLDLRDTQIHMCMIANQVPPPWMPRSYAQAVAMATNPAPVRIPEMDGKLGVGVVWEQPVDVDEYAWVRGIGPVYFNCKSNQFAAYGTDYQHGTARSEAEWITFTNVSLNDVETWVNYYAGTNTAVRGKVIVNWGGRTTVGDWSLRATSGNRGGDLSTRATSPWWTRLDIQPLTTASR